MATRRFFNSGCVQGHFLYLFSQAEAQLVFFFFFKLNNFDLLENKQENRSGICNISCACTARWQTWVTFFLFSPRLPLFSRGAFQRRPSPAPSSLLTLEAVRRSAGLFDRSVVLHKLQVH